MCIGLVDLNLTPNAKIALDLIKQNPSFSNCQVNQASYHGPGWARGVLPEVLCRGTNGIDDSSI